MKTYQFGNEFGLQVISLDGYNDCYKYILEEDLKMLVERAGYVKNRREHFPAFDVTPILNIEEGLKRGNYTETHYLDPKLFKSTSLPLEPKRIILASFREKEYCTTTLQAFQRQDYNLLFKEYKLKLVENPIYYFLGLLAIDAVDWSVTKACYEFMLTHDSKKPEEQTDKTFAKTTITGPTLDLSGYHITAETCLNESENFTGRELSFSDNAWFCDKEKFHMFEAL